MADETKTGVNGWNIFRNLLFLSLMVLFAYSLFQLIRHKEPISGLLPPGTASPDFSLPDLETGQLTRLSDFRGKGVIIVFWATWCPACRSELKLIEKIQQEYGGKNLAIITINQDQMSPRRPAVVLGYLEKNKLTLPVLLDDGSAQDRYAVNTLPYTVFVDPGGKVLTDYVNLQSFNTIAERTEALIDLSKTHQEK